MKKLLLSAAVLAACGSSAFAQLNENFNNGIPSTWTMINDGKTPSTSFSAAYISRWTANAWAGILRTAGDSAVAAPSYFTPAGKADRWLISPSFTVTSGMFLLWDDKAGNANYIDSLQVLVSPTAGTTAASFTQTIWNAGGSTSGNFATRAVSLSAYVGQTITVAFRNNSTDEVLLFLDNVKAQVLPGVDASLVNLTPTVGSPTAYGMSGSNITLGGTVYNYGGTALTSYTLNYQVAGGPVVTQAVTGNIAPYASAPVAFATPYTIPGTGTYNVKAWVSATGDANNTNDTANTMLGGYAFLPKKRLLMEEATGTWCGWCVRGSLYMDSVWKTYPNDISVIAVHNQDPMTVTAYDAYVGTMVSGYPNMLVDRRINDVDPSDAFNQYNSEHTSFGFAEMMLGTINATSTTFSVPVNVRAATDLNGDYRLVLVLTEDGVQNAAAPAGSNWEQHNYYSGQANSGSYALPTSSTFGDFHALANPIPAGQIHYDFVARSITPSVSGTAGVLPSTMTVNNTYSATLTATLDPSWNQSRMRAVVMLLNNATGAVMNTVNSTLPLGVSNVSAGISKFSVYPNPTNDAASASIQLDAASKVTVEMFDVLGRKIASLPEVKLPAGEHTVQLPLSNLASGLYNVKITTEKGSVTERLSVVK